MVLKKNEPVITVKGLCKSYGSAGSRTVALDHVDQCVYRGEMVAILGNSGCGKTTLLNMIGGMDPFDEGSVIAGGCELASLNDRKLTDYRRRAVGFVFQSFNLISELTAIENVALTAKKDDKDISMRMLGTVGLADKAKSYPYQLSGGQQQRVSIARALAKDPEFFLCDEPTGSLDSETGKTVLECLEKLVRELGKTVVIVTHNQEIARIADRTIVMKNGRITEDTVNDHVLSVSEAAW